MAKRIFFVEDGLDGSPILNGFKAIGYEGLTFSERFGVTTSSIGGGGGTSTGWSLDGNTTGGIKYFGTNDNYSIPIYTNGLARGVIGNNGDFAFGTSSLVSNTRFYIKGFDSTSSNFGLKIESSVNTSLLSVRNDGLISNNGVVIGRGYGNVSSNTALGEGIYNNSTTGSSNVGVGNYCLTNLQNGVSNVGIGNQSLRSITTGGNNVSIGRLSQFNNSSGGANISIGDNSLNGLTTGSNNIAIGSGSIQSSNSNYNISVGFYSGIELTSGVNNVFIGPQNAGRGITTGSYNVIIGSINGLATTLSNTIILGDGAGIERLRINSSGNLGINTTSPTTKLHINATASGAGTGFRLQDTTEGSGKVLTSDANGVGTWQVASGGGGNGVTASGTVNYISKFTSTNVLGNSLIYDNGTNVGIGTGTPNRLLTLNSANTYFGFKVNDVSKVSLGSDSVGEFVIYSDAGGGYRLKMDNSGRFMIGDAGFGDSQFDVVKNTSSDWVGRFVNSSSSTTIRGLSVHLQNASSSSSTILELLSQDTSRLLVDGSGNIGIGTTSPTTKLHINATASGTGFRLVDTTQGSGKVLTSDANGVGTWQVASGGGGNGVTASGTTNYISKFTSTNVLGNSLIYDNGSSIGIGITSSTARLQIVGSGFTSATKPLIITNSLGRNLINIQDDIYATFGDYNYDSYVSFRGAGGDLNIQSNSGAFVLEIKPFVANNLLHISKGASGADAFATIDTVTGNWVLSNVGSSYNAKDTTTKLKVVGSDTTSSNFALKVQNSGGLGLFEIQNDGQSTFRGKTSSVISPTVVKIVGGDSTSSNFGLKVDNLSGSPLLYVRNDGYVQTGGGVKILSSGLYPSLTFENSSSHTANIQMYYNELYFTTGGQQSVLSNIGLSLGTNAGAGARLHVKGQDSTSSYFSLKVENTSSSPLLNVRNDGYVAIGLATASATLHVKGATGTTGSTVFKVDGNAGELFTITDNLTGSLFSVNDISGLPIIEAFSDSTILMGDYSAPSLYTTKKVTANSGTTDIYSIATASYTGAYYDYTISDGTNARSGNITAVWLGSNIQYKETSTLDIGSTSNFTFSVVQSGTYSVLRTSASTNGWVVKTIIRSI